MAGFDDILGLAGGAVSDLFGAQGSEAAGAAYGKAADIATKNAALTERSGQIQLQQENIAITKAIGGEQASTSGAEPTSTTRATGSTSARTRSASKSDAP